MFLAFYEAAKVLQGNGSFMASQDIVEDLLIKFVSG